jgi:uncharacterized protein YkwD
MEALLQTREGYNFRTFGENIAAGQQNADQVVNAWFNSEGHRRNMLNPAFEEMGCKLNLKSNERWMLCGRFNI